MNHIGLKNGYGSTSPLHFAVLKPDKQNPVPGKQINLLSPSLMCIKFVSFITETTSHNHSIIEGSLCFSMNEQSPLFLLLLIDEQSLPEHPVLHFIFSLLGEKKQGVVRTVLEIQF